MTIANVPDGNASVRMVEGVVFDSVELVHHRFQIYPYFKLIKVRFFKQFLVKRNFGVQWSVVEKNLNSFVERDSDI